MEKHAKKSYKQQLRESEARNLGLVRYLQDMEARCKQVLLVAGDQYNQMNQILTPEGERLKPIMAMICAIVAPVCQDVEDMKLSPDMVAEMVKQGGKLIQFSDEVPPDDVTKTAETPAEPAESEETDGQEGSVET